MQVLLHSPGRVRYKHGLSEFRALFLPFIINLGLRTPHAGVQLLGLNCSSWQGGAAFLCDRVPHARLLSAQCVTLLEFAGPP